MRQNCILLPQKDAAGEVEHVCVTLMDFTDTAMYQMRLNELIDQLKEEKAAQQVLIGKLEDAQGQLLQSEKMASVGQLAAGVAHEINNPIGFVNSNLGSLKGQVESLLSVLSAYEEVENALKGQPDLLASLQQAKIAADLDFLRDDILDLINESLDGVQRVKKIVENLRDFSRVDASEWHYANLEQGLESTLNIVWNEIKYKAEVIREYAGLPDVECIAAQINQVFMNLLVNAAHAIHEQGVVTVRTGCAGDEVWVEIADNGEGIAPENLSHIFDPFFTTRAVGKGSGLGLSISYGIIEKHHGRIEVESELGRGTRFRIGLPVRQPGEHLMEGGD
jgi:signal transduction histidine kinase